MDRAYPPHQSLTVRDDFATLLDTAILSGANRFARQITLTWLAYYPGDLPVRLKYGQLLLNASQTSKAIKALSELCQADPEFVEAWELLSIALKRNAGDLPQDDNAFYVADCNSAINALGGNSPSDTPLPAWSNGLRQTRQALSQGEIELADRLLHKYLMVEPLPPLIAITHLEIVEASTHPRQTLQNLASFYRQRFPTTVAPILLLADSLIDGGEPEKAVALLHQSATLDVTGQVAERILGYGHPYSGIWPDKLEAPIDIPIPADVAALLGWNSLPCNASTPPISLTKVIEDTLDESPDSNYEDLISFDRRNRTPQNLQGMRVINLGAPVNTPNTANEKTGRPTPPERTLPESLCSINAELEKVAIKIKNRQLVNNDGRFPVYVIFTTRSGLEKQYGQEAFDTLDQEMKHVVKRIASHRNWDAKLVYADDPGCMSTFDLSSATANDPWSLKLALTDLDTSLSRKGEMIGAVLIVGGPEVIPFHNLPNPVDDIDLEVPSDNPYTTRDENYFIPEWPVGRLPGGNQKDIQPLIIALQEIAEHHANHTQYRTWFQRLWDRLRFNRLFSSQKKINWGYTAAIWRRASLSVFRPIGDPHTMLISPPVQVADDNENIPSNDLFPTARMGYFNLHGIQDSSNWYGQRDPTEPSDQPDYPIALRPQDVVNGGRAPQVVFSEACYGAHINNKSIEDALALKFLTSGSQAVVGSTCTSYGSITTPLIAADLLGHAFWNYLREGFATGEALRRAKIHLAKEMHRRQGYLDGEDQKTLISFVLYGDPLAHLTSVSSSSKTIFRPLHTPKPVKIVCDRNGNCHQSGVEENHSLQGSPPLPEPTLSQVKLIVEQYLPGMADAQITYAKVQSACSGDGHSCPTSSMTAKSEPFKDANRNVVTLSKQVSEAASSSNSTRIHHHYARLTFGEKGKVIKLAVSR